MKKPILFTVAASLFFVNCSKDDDGGGSKCESCTIEAGKIEICNNDDGTYTVTIDGEIDAVVSESALNGKSPKEYICD